MVITKRLAGLVSLLLLGGCGTYNGAASLAPDPDTAVTVAYNTTNTTHPFCTPGGPNRTDDNAGTICGRVFFTPSTATFSPEALQTLRTQAYFLEKNRKALDTTPIILSSRCDETHLADDTLALGERRAKAVRKYFMASGVPADLIKIERCHRDNPFVRAGGAAALEADGSVDLSVCVPNGPCIQPRT